MNVQRKWSDSQFWGHLKKNSFQNSTHRKLQLQHPTSPLGALFHQLESLVSSSMLLGRKQTLSVEINGACIRVLHPEFLVSKSLDPFNQTKVIKWMWAKASDQIQLSKSNWPISSEWIHVSEGKWGKASEQIRVNEGKWADIWQIYARYTPDIC